MRVLTLGPEGTFSHQAAKKLFPEKKLVFASSVDEVFFRLSDPSFLKVLSPWKIPLQILLKPPSLI